MNDTRNPYMPTAFDRDPSGSSAREDDLTTSVHDVTLADAVEDVSASEHDHAGGDGDGEAEGREPSTRAVLASLDHRLEQLHAAIHELGHDKQLIEHLQHANRQFSEQFHEREVLDPIARGLIGMADRCRDQTAELKELLVQQQCGEGDRFARVIRYLIKARQADCLEIENLLADLGVEKQQSARNRFDPGSQRVVRRIGTRDIHQRSHIARYHHPGYRRGERMIRPELVSVYVFG